MLDPFEALAERSDGLVFVTDSAMRMLYASSALERETGGTFHGRIVTCMGSAGNVGGGDVLHQGRFMLAVFEFTHVAVEVDHMDSFQSRGSEVGRRASLPDCPTHHVEVRFRRKPVRLCTCSQRI